VRVLLSAPKSQCAIEPLLDVLAQGAGQPQHLQSKP
jgi:hypothetical protein